MPKITLYSAGRLSTEVFFTCFPNFQLFQSLKSLWDPFHEPRQQELAHTQIPKTRTSTSTNHWWMVENVLSLLCFTVWTQPTKPHTNPTNNQCHEEPCRNLRQWLPQSLAPFEITSLFWQQRYRSGIRWTTVNVHELVSAIPIDLTDDARDLFTRNPTRHLSPFVGPPEIVFPVFSVFAPGKQTLETTFL